MKKVFDFLQSRGLVEQSTDPESVQKLLNDEKITFYIGFDATADSLHVGHFLQLTIMRYMQQAGHRPIALLGGGTTMIGDPTGKSDMRKMLTKEQIDHNAACFKTQMEKFIDFSDGKALMLNNADWLLPLNYISFLRDFGVHFSVNKMLSMDSVKTRLERGLSFMEFNYMILQSFDFLHLFETHNCVMQFGGSDQWSNILGGVDLIRRIHAKEAYGLTFTLLTTKDGRKMGKTEGGTVWLDAEKTPPYDFYQYWRNIDDAEVGACLRLLTDIDLARIDAYEQKGGAALNEAKELLAHTLTARVHSTEEADKARATAKALFARGDGGKDDAHMPATALSTEEVPPEGLGILDLLVRIGLAKSKGEGRRLIDQGGVLLDGEKVEDPLQMVAVAALEKGVVIRKGKKIYHRAIVG